MTDSTTAPTPNREVIEKWITALESGDYSQSRGVLQNQEGFCCLGVLCDLAVKDGVLDAPEWSREKEGFVYSEAGVDILDPDAPHAAFWSGTNSTTLPEIVQRWAGLQDENPTVTYPRVRDMSCDDNEVKVGYAPIADLNDSYGFTFPELAQVIRDNFLKPND